MGTQIKTFLSSRDHFWQLVIVATIAMVSVTFWSFNNIETAQAAVPTPYNTIQLLDSNNNGKIDRITFNITNGTFKTWVTVGALPYGLSATQDGNPIDITAVTVTSAATNPAIVQVDLDEDDMVVDTNGVTSNAVELIYAMVNGNNTCVDCIQDGVAMELGATATGDGTPAAVEIDAAAPVVTSVTPASGATGVINTTSIVMNFSEAMDTGFVYATEFTSTPDPSGWGAAAWSNGDKTVTLSHTAYGCLAAVNFATDDAELVDVALTPHSLNTAATLDGDWSFTTKSCGSSNSGTGTTNVSAPTYSVRITSPNGSETLVGNTTKEITWTNGGTATPAYANLFYTLDNGITHTLISKNESNDGSYMWTVPDISALLAVIRLETHDLGATSLALDTSDNPFSIDLASVGEVPSEVNTPTSGGTGLSPVTGLVEQISQVNAGDYIKSPFFATVYYIDSNLVRHPFTDTQTYFTWQTSFESIKVVTDATLTTLALGSPMLPKPGVILVKMQSDPKVYALETNQDDAFKPFLRWVKTEAAAQSIYGSNWQDYVIDIPVTLFSRFIYSTDIEDSSDAHADATLMRTREWLNGR